MLLDPSTDTRRVARGIEAGLALTIAGTLRRTLPTRRWQRIMGAPGGIGTADVRSGEPSGSESEVSEALGRASRRLPWHSNCLDEAAAGQLMLRRRGVPGAVVIGLRPGEAWGTHAWLVGSTGVLTGAGADDYTPVSAFRPDARGRT